jgi:hypothetical protein
VRSAKPVRQQEPIDLSTQAAGEAKLGVLLVTSTTCAIMQDASAPEWRRVLAPSADLTRTKGEHELL